MKCKTTRNVYCITPMRMHMRPCAHAQDIQNRDPLTEKCLHSATRGQKLSREPLTDGPTDLELNC